jgi:hypothetical protein
MKLAILKLGVASLITASIALVACEKEMKYVADPVEAGSASQQAFLKIVHAAPNLRAITGQPDSFNVIVNDLKLNAVNVTYAVTQPTGTTLTYSAVAADSRDVVIKLARGVNKPDSLVFFTFYTKMAPGNYYTFLITDSLLQTRDTSRMFFRDSLATLLDGRTGIRLVHALADTANLRIDIWSTRRNNNLYSSILPGTVTSFSNQPFINLGDTLIVRRAGTQFELARLNNIIFGNGRQYTLVYRGTNVTTGTRARTLTFYTNK